MNVSTYPIHTQQIQRGQAARGPPDTSPLVVAMGKTHKHMQSINTCAASEVWQMLQNKSKTSLKGGRGERDDRARSLFPLLLFCYRTMLLLGWRSHNHTVEDAECGACGKSSVWIYLERKHQSHKMISSVYTCLCAGSEVSDTLCPFTQYSPVHI